METRLLNAETPNIVNSNDNVLLTRLGCFVRSKIGFLLHDRHLILLHDNSDCSEPVDSM